MVRASFFATVVCALVALGGCVQPNRTGLDFDAGDARGADAGDARDLGADNAGPVDAPSDAAVDATITADAGDTGGPAPDMTMAECTPRQIACSDEMSTRTCSEQGRWMTPAPCPADTRCSAGVCLCPGNCSGNPIAETQTPGLVADLAGGGRFLYMAVNGPMASIRRFDLQTGMETVVKMGDPPATLFALDSDGMGNLLWCSDTGMGMSRTGQLVNGTQTLETGPCTHVRRHDDLAYFKADVLYRRPLGAGGSRVTVTRETLDLFEIAGAHLYFVAEMGTGAVLKRLPLADFDKLETITSRPNTSFFRMMPDATHVYLVSEGEILRVAQTANAQAESFWRENGPEAWAIAQTDTHVYWSATTYSGTMDCGGTQVLRRPKAGGPVATLAQTPGYCAGPLTRIGDHIYTAVWRGIPGTSPTRILRIRL